MLQPFTFVAMLAALFPSEAELPHLSVEEFHKHSSSHERHQVQDGGVRGGSVISSGAIKVSTPANMMLSSLELEAGLEKSKKQKQRCVDPYRSIPVYGWRWFQSFQNNVTAALNCWGTSEIQARMRDSNFELRRTQCMRRVLSARRFVNPRQELSSTHLDEIMCHILTEAIRSKDPHVQFARRVKLCMRDVLKYVQLNNTIHLEDVRVNCMQKHKSTSMKPSIQDAELGSEFNLGYEMYVNAVRTADALLAEMAHCLRYFSLTGKEAEEYEVLDKSCRNQSWAKTANQHFDNEYQVDVCIFSNSTKGRVARDDISVQYSCLNQLLSSSTLTKRSQIILLDIFWNQTQPIHMEKQISCKALSGRPRWIKSVSGWELTCERLRTLKAKRQVEVEDASTEESDLASSSQPGKSGVRAKFDATTGVFIESPLQPITSIVSATENSSRSITTDRFQALEELNRCIIAKIRTSSARASLNEMGKAHRQWQQKHMACWNKLKGDEGQFSTEVRPQLYRHRPA